MSDVLIDDLKKESVEVHRKAWEMARDNRDNDDPEKEKEMKRLLISFQKRCLDNFGPDTTAEILTFGVTSLYFEKNKEKQDLALITHQLELWPEFKPQKSVELKREFALNFGFTDRIEKEHAHLLSTKLTGGLTLQQQINKVKNWFNDLRGDDLGNWIKIFAYAKAVKEYNDENNEMENFKIVSPGKYRFLVKQNKDFFSYFIRPNKKGQFETKTKERFLKWLHDNQKTIDFPVIINGDVWNIPARIYEYAEDVTNNTLLFVIDTNILESEFRDYVSINIDEINHISELWEEIADQDAEFKTLWLNKFVDIPLKFLLTLKNIYSREGNFTNQKSGFVGNTQRLSRESLDQHLGGLSERIEKHLISRNQIRTGKSSNKPKEIKTKILNATFEIAAKRKWLLSMPDYDKEKELYHFNLNAGYFDRKESRKRIEAL